MDIVDDLHEEEGQESNIWLSIGDLMSGLLLVFVLLFVVLLFQLDEARERALRKAEEAGQAQARAESLWEELKDMIRVTQETRQNIRNLIKDLEERFEAVKVNPETGDVSIEEAILFDENKTFLKPDGQRFLREFVGDYSGILFSNASYEGEIARIVIEGHASSKGDREHNMDLSVRRALSVMQFIFELEGDGRVPEGEKLIRKILVGGRGESDADQEIDDPADRKVLFRLQFQPFNEEDLRNFIERGA